MRRAAMIRALACALGAALSSAPLAAERDGPSGASPPSADTWNRGLLFRLERPGVAPSYVFGTVHSGDPRVIALAPPVREAFASARTLALEIRLGEGDLDEVFAAAQFDDGRRLDAFFDPPTVEAIRFELAGAVRDEAALMRLKPWAVLLKLAERPAPQSAGPTLDESLLEAALVRRMRVIGLELPEEQIATFDAISLPAQVALVEFVLDDRDALTRDHDAVVAAWLDRDLARLAFLAAAPARTHPKIAPYLAEFMRHVVDDRTVVMAHRLFMPLRAGRVFVAVGALHLDGERGLLALLRTQGYRVRRVWRRPPQPARCRRKMAGAASRLPFPTVPS
jgi:uncharacterized protein YbaP (TraB family)